MEMSETELESFVRNLKELNNSTENEIIALADRVIELRKDLYLIERTLGELAEIAKRAKGHPS